MVSSYVREDEPLNSSRRMSTEKADNAGVAFHPPLLLAGSIAVAFGARWALPFSFLPPRLSAMTGPIVVAASFALFFWSIYTMRREGGSIPTGQPTDAIVIRGPYRFSRNPIYLSMLLLQAGLGIWTNSGWFLVLSLVSFVLLTWGVISREERYLERKFGKEYLTYKARARRWL